MRFSCGPWIRRCTKIPGVWMPSGSRLPSGTISSTSAMQTLPQVAAFAQHHFRVLKDDDGNVTSSSVVRLEGQDRVDELARMLAGLEDSSAAQQHARELLELAGHA